jgi:hypothetical protein
MIKLAELQKRAALVGRALFASLPFHVRLAHVFSVLADVDLQSLGRSLGKVFIEKKVQGLPDVHGVPALDWPAAKPLPPKYLEDLAGHLRHALRVKFHSDQLVEAAIDNWLFRFVVERGYHNMQENVDFKKATNYVLHSLEQQVLNEIKAGKRKKRDNESLDETYESEEGESRHKYNPADPDTPATIYENISPHDMPKVRQKLEAIHPDAAIFVDLRLDGWEATEIVGDPARGIPTKLPHLKEHPLSYRNWKKMYEPKIQNVLSEFVHQAA